MSGATFCVGPSFISPKFVTAGIGDAVERRS
jgi:hypothetical protein